MMQTHHTRQGFTLIEILIVGALLSLLAGIAIFNISEMYQNNMKKAAVGEVKNLATACAMAQQDIGFVPKFNYLTTPAQYITTSAAAPHIRADFDYMGFINPNNDWDINTTSITSRFTTRGYYAFSSTRGGLNRGKGGIVKVRLPSLATGTPAGQDDLEGSLVDWPADPWGNPYVLYQLKVNKPAAGQPANPDEPKWKFIESLKEDADYMMAVVSYGPNGIPGAVWEKRSSGDLFGRGAGISLNWAKTAEMSNARLYVDGDPLVPNGPARYTMLRPLEFKLGNSAAATLRNWIVKGPDANDGAGVTRWNNMFPTDGLPQSGGGLEVRGITDPGSDDIVYVF